MKKTNFKSENVVKLTMSEDVYKFLGYVVSYFSDADLSAQSGEDLRKLDFLLKAAGFKGDAFETYSGYFDEGSDDYKAEEIPLKNDSVLFIPKTSKP